MPGVTLDRGRIDTSYLHSEEMDEVLARCSVAAWRQAGWELVEGTGCGRASHHLVEVHVGLEIARMCGHCGRVYLSGRIDEKLAKYAATRGGLKEVS